MTGIGDGRLGNVVADGVNRFAFVEEEDALVPRDRDHDAHAEFLREIEKPARRGVVDAQDVDAELAHQAEIDRHFFRRGKIRPSFRGRTERPVGHALEIELGVALKKEFRPHLKARKISPGDRRRGNDIMHGRSLTEAAICGKSESFLRKRLARTGESIQIDDL